MKYLGWLVALAIVTLALAGDPTCPSDINDDETVSTADLLQLLGDWGPCPSPVRVIDMDTQQQTDRLLRLWSDGTVECGLVLGVGQCAITGPPVWQEIPNEPPPPRGVRVLSVDLGRDSVGIVYRLLSDGTIEWNAPRVQGECGIPKSEWCGWQVLP